jgi:multisubunit Na+/H+ antiporter MnhB subunit
MIQNKEAGMTLIVKTVTRMTLWFIIAYGVYIAITGHISPGGGFPGGVIIALALVHAVLAFGKDKVQKVLSADLVRILIGSSALLFLAAEFLAPEKIRAIVAPVLEMLVVGLGLFAIFAVLVVVGKQNKPSEPR